MVDNTFAIEETGEHDLRYSDSAVLSSFFLSFICVSLME